MCQPIDLRTEVSAGGGENVLCATKGQVEPVNSDRRQQR